MQQSLRPFDGTDLSQTTEDLLNAIKANMAVTAGPQQTDSTYHETWIVKNCHDTNSSNRKSTTVIFTLSTRKKELASVLPRVSKNI